MGKEIFGKRIASERKKLGLSQAELAKKLNVSQTAIAKQETGKNYPSIELLEDYADLFGCSVDYLLGRVDEPTHIKKDLPDDDGKVVSVEYDVLKPPSDDAMAAAVEAAKKALAEFYSQDSE